MAAVDSFLRFLGQATAGVVRYGVVFAPAEVVAQRKAKCDVCPLNRDGRCQDTVVDGQLKVGCGCILQLKVEAAASSCPQGEWTAWVPEKVSV